MLLLYLCGAIAGIFLLGSLLLKLLLWPFKVRRAARRWFKVTLISYLLFLPLFVFLLLPILLSYLVANSSTRPQDRSIKRSPTDFGRSFKEVTFASRDGIKLRGWFMGAEGEKPGIVLSHGLFRNRQEVLERACLLNQADYSTLVFDFRNHGRSQRKHVSLGFNERLDVLAACDFLTMELGDVPLVLFGVSMGAVASIHAAGEVGPELTAVIVDSPFRSLKETVTRHTRLFLGMPTIPFANIFVWNLARIGEFDPSDVDTIAALRRLGQSSTLLIYGAEDRRIPSATSRAIWEAIPHPNKRIARFEGATHGAAFRSAPDRYMSLLTDFLENRAATTSKDD